MILNMLVPPPAPLPPPPPTPAVTTAAEEDDVGPWHQRLGLVLGIDTGLDGGLALIDPSDRRIVQLRAMPTYKVVTNVGKKEVRRVDPFRLADIVREMLACGMRSAVMETAGGLPKQSAPAAYAFGFSGGVILGTLAALEVPVDLYPSATWKVQAQVPKTVEAIYGKACEVFGEDECLRWGMRNPERTIKTRAGKKLKIAELDRGAVNDGLCEAALLVEWYVRQLEKKAGSKKGLPAWSRASAHRAIVSAGG